MRACVRLCVRLCVHPIVERASMKRARDEDDGDDVRRMEAEPDADAEAEVTARVQREEGVEVGGGEREDDTGTMRSRSAALSSLVLLAAPTTVDLTPRLITFAHRYVVAPMVGQSDLPFRLMCRSYAASLCYTPMYLAHEFAAYTTPSAPSPPSTAVCPSLFRTCPSDRPLIVQFAANSPDHLVQAGLRVQSHCDAIDLNLGCPQDRARTGHYGSYLLDRKDWPLVARMVAAARVAWTVPIVCKIRLLDTVDLTIEFCRMLIAHGCSLIAVHGRHRGSKRRRRAGAADLDAIRRIRAALPRSVPVLSNGNVRCFGDVLRNLEQTQCDGVMVGEACLANPALFVDVAVEHSRAPKVCADEPMRRAVWRDRRGGGDAEGGNVAALADPTRRARPTMRLVRAWQLCIEYMEWCTREIDGVCSPLAAVVTRGESTTQAPLPPSQEQEQQQQQQQLPPRLRWIQEQLWSMFRAVAMRGENATQAPFEQSHEHPQQLQQPQQQQPLHQQPPLLWIQDHLWNMLRADTSREAELSRKTTLRHECIESIDELRMLVRQYRDVDWPEGGERGRGR